MNWLRKVMAGRYGMDQLSIALLFLAVFFSVLSGLTRIDFFYLVSLIVLIVCNYRVFSKQFSKRSAENRAFLKLWNPVQKQCELISKQIRDIKTHRYYKCPNCMQVLRVPRGKGKICITCPKCKHELHKRT